MTFPALVILRTYSLRGLRGRQAPKKPLFEVGFAIFAGKPHLKKEFLSPRRSGAEGEVGKAQCTLIISRA